MKPLQDIFPLFAVPRNVVVTMHQKPDPDAMGSSLALYQFLRSFGNEVTVISPTNWPTWLNWMPGADLVIDYELKPEKALAALSAADSLFCLDFNIFSRTKGMTDSLYAFKGMKVLVDHHQQPDSASFDYGISDTGKSSTCEMIYDLIVQSGNEDRIDTAIAECLYAGVIADTGSFRFPSTAASVHLMVADLKGRGLNHARVHENIYDNFLENRLRFLGFVLMNRMEIYYEYNTALIAITKKDLLRFQIKTGDTEGIVNYPLSIQGIKLAALVIDRDEERKWSFRSKNGFDTNTFARTYFRGGGHFNASGGRSADPLEKTVETFRQAMKENAENLR